jgi:trk system potassium uptake protein TrkA
MKVLIVGAGQVGQTVAQELAPDHAVVAIDRRYEALEQVPGAARVVQGDGVELDVLQEGDVDEADILIACTDDDRTNILICSTAKLEGDPFAIARVAHTQFLDTWHHSRKAFGVDLMVGRSSLTARSVARLVGFQSAEETAFEERFFAGASRWQSSRLRARAHLRARRSSMPIGLRASPSRASFATGR